MKILQLGTSWFPEEAGGLARIYYGCVNHLPQIGVEVHGLVTGSDRIFQDSDGKVQAFASTDSSTLQRLQSLRKIVTKTLAKDSKPKYDLIASHFALYTFPILDRLGKLPLVIHFHGP
jgi:hypothetical protein